ncbi:protein CURVATURE THYLAKOID 1B, chloroplastic-like [Hordeum vulgare subsp. vulgare]|uniref:protein CURVATURE THYLAKOID 1B, chloroplastic-like n=1 Tax=Hordeum vulgare subsp. vulgare TaxID=112509 RepID=UPI000296BF5D|nr:protein CURVATURE THYLAKOID 1B, chloroplastic-like [Hordeum vulgare subsp. vulgare]
MAPTVACPATGAVACPATGAVASPIAGDVGKAARSAGLGLPALPSLPGLASHGQPRIASFCKRLARNVVSMAASEPAAPLAENAELTELFNSLKQEWDRVGDKYAVTTLAVAATLGMWSAGGVVSAIDRLPVVPGLMEVVGIGYSGWFAYKNLIFKPDRKAFFAKVRNIYEDIISG